MFKPTLALLALAGCAPLSYGSLATSTALIACDWSQTRAAAETHWRNAVEFNPLLGPSPTPGQVDGYFLASALTNVAIWAILPRYVDWVIPSVVTVGQTITVVDNQAVMPGICGLEHSHSRL